MDSQLFDFGGHNVRVVMDERKEPWFVLKDVCDVLELSNSRKVASSLDERDKGVTTSDTLGGKQQFRGVVQAYHVKERLDEAGLFVQAATVN